MVHTPALPFCTAVCCRCRDAVRMNESGVRKNGSTAGILYINENGVTKNGGAAPGWAGRPLVQQGRHALRRQRLAPPRFRPHCHFRNRGTEYVSESSIKQISGSTKRHCNRALAPPPGAHPLQRVQRLPYEGSVPILGSVALPLCATHASALYQNHYHDRCLRYQNDRALPAPAPAPPAARAWPPSLAGRALPT
jgi:hypothetical protein